MHRHCRTARTLGGLQITSAQASGQVPLAPATHGFHAQLSAMHLPPGGDACTQAAGRPRGRDLLVIALRCMQTWLVGTGRSPAPQQQWKNIPFFASFTRTGVFYFPVAWCVLFRIQLSVGLVASSGVPVGIKPQAHCAGYDVGQRSSEEHGVANQPRTCSHKLVTTPPYRREVRPATGLLM